MPISQEEFENADPVSDENVVPQIIGEIVRRKLKSDEKDSCSRSTVRKQIMQMPEFKEELSTHQWLSENIILARKKYGYIHTEDDRGQRINAFEEGEHNGDLLRILLNKEEVSMDEEIFDIDPYYGEGARSELANFEDSFNPNISVGEELDKDELEDRFNTSFGYRVKGINLRKTENGEQYIILVSKEDGPYRDQISDENEFYYIGEGLPEKGDQKKTAANKALMNAVNEDIPIYLFTSNQDNVWVYQGMAEVEDFQYVNNGERNVYRFKMEKLELNPEEFEEVQDTVVEEEPELTEDQEFTTTERRIRSSTFGKEVKRLYDFQCAFCGAKRFSPEGNPEVEAAHIYPKEEGGNDNIRNGLALCRLHHWAFDYGWISLNDDLEILLKKDVEQEIPESFNSLEGGKINLPEEESKKPHQKFLKAHRELHSF